MKKKKNQKESRLYGIWERLDLYIKRSEPGHEIKSQEKKKKNLKIENYTKKET